MTKQISRLGIAAACVYLLASGVAQGTMITLGGTVTQSPQDGGATAVANPALNNVVDADAFTIQLSFAGPIGGPGAIPLTSVSFVDTTVSAYELGFISGTAVITTAGSMSQFAVVGCLISASSCLTGNQLALNFQVPTSSLTGSNISAQPIPALLAVDLLEDDGATEIQGTLSNYSYTGTTSTPEPSTLTMIAIGAGCLLLSRRRSGNFKLKSLIKSESI